MKKKIFVSIISFKEVAKSRLSIALMLSLIVVASRSYAQTNPRYVALQGSVLSALYTPDAALNLPPPHVALIFMQRTSNYLSTAGCTELSRRGFMVLCMNASFYNNEAEVDWNQIAIDVRRGVDFVRSQAGISKVVLVGLQCRRTDHDFLSSSSGKRSLILQWRQQDSPVRDQSSGPLPKQTALS